MAADGDEQVLLRAGCLVAGMGLESQ